jgi:hypothetical protein
MALFTVVLEFNGGTYISQFRVVSPRAALKKYAAQVVGNTAIGQLPTRRRLADQLKADEPIAIEGVHGVWCCSAVIGRKGALVNIVKTAV